MDFLFRLVIFRPPHISCASTKQDEVAYQGEIR